jgi:hypothetical protein
MSYSEDEISDLEALEELQLQEEEEARDQQQRIDDLGQLMLLASNQLELKMGNTQQTITQEAVEWVDKNFDTLTEIYGTIRTKKIGTEGSLFLNGNFLHFVVMMCLVR